MSLVIANLIPAILVESPSTLDPLAVNSPSISFGETEKSPAQRSVSLKAVTLDSIGPAVDGASANMES